jgi:hypothetical protein
MTPLGCELLIKVVDIIKVPQLCQISHVSANYNEENLLIID